MIKYPFRDTKFLVLYFVSENMRDYLGSSWDWMKILLRIFSFFLFYLMVNYILIYIYIYIYGQFLIVLLEKREGEGDAQIHGLRSSYDTTWPKRLMGFSPRVGSRDTEFLVMGQWQFHFELSFIFLPFSNKIWYEASGRIWRFK